jgi:hypothetical protein
MLILKVIALIALAVGVIVLCMKAVAAIDCHINHWKHHASGWCRECWRRV